MVAVSGKPYSRGRSCNIDSGRSSGCSQQPDGVNESTRKVVREKPKNNQSGGRPDHYGQEASTPAQGVRGRRSLVRDDGGGPGRGAIGPLGFPGTIESRSRTRDHEDSRRDRPVGTISADRAAKTLCATRPTGSTPTAADSRRDGSASHSGRAAPDRDGDSATPADPVSPRRNGSGSRTPPGSAGPPDQ